MLRFKKTAGWFQLVLLLTLPALAMAGAGLGSARAAQLAGVTMPSTETVDSTKLVLNGIGLRTYSFLAIHIYVAGLYLEQPCHNAQAILAAPGPKVVQIQFVHSVGADALRRAWKKGLQRNCVAPCTLSPTLLSRFLGALRPVRAGDLVTFVFDAHGSRVYYNGQLAGQINNPQFAKLMLAAFLGPHPSDAQLERALLGP